MTNSYKGIVNSSIRKYWFPERRHIEIIDEIDPALPYIEARWAIVTAAEISLHGHEALLRQNGEEFKVTILEPEGAEFVELSTRPENPGPDEELNEGTTMLATTVYQESTSPFTIKVALTSYDTMLSQGITGDWVSERLDHPRLLGGYPNPFAGDAMITFDLPSQERVSLDLYNRLFVRSVNSSSVPGGRPVIS